MQIFPHNNHQEMDEYYGKTWRLVNGKVEFDPNFEHKHIIRIGVPYPMKMGSSNITRIAINKRCADSLSECLQVIKDKLTPEEIKLHHLDQYGGGFNQRMIRGANGGLDVRKLSAHAYGAAIDLAVDYNPLGREWKEGWKMMPVSVINIFKDNGWSWGGDFKSRPDCQHFSATR